MKEIQLIDTIKTFIMYNIRHSELVLFAPDNETGHSFKTCSALFICMCLRSFFNYIAHYTSFYGIIL